MRSMPSISPSHPWVSAWARRASSSVWISSSRPSILGSTCSMGQRMQACSCSQGGCVGSAALAELNLALVEVLLELGLLLVGDGPVVGCRAGGAAIGEVGLVQADDVFLEHRHVAVEGLHVEVAEQGSTDVDGQPVVGPVGGEQASEVVRGEPDLLQFRVLRWRGSC